MVTRRRLTMVHAAIQKYRLETGSYPESLNQLEGNIVNQLPRDPFSGNQFRYERSPDGSDYILYGVGPDRVDNPGRTPYDPVNGTYSSGVIF